jgi:hypothetical protein
VPRELAVSARPGRDQQPGQLPQAAYRRAVEVLLSWRRRSLQLPD